MEQPEKGEVTTVETIDAGPVAALSALFDDGLALPGMGAELPPLWHWAALARWPVASRVGTDGHPLPAAFLPPPDLPRRMFAGGEVVWYAGLRIGEKVRRVSTVQSMTEKSGRSGKLALVVIVTRLYADDGTLAVEERQNLIYREAPAPGAAILPEPDSHATRRLVGSPFRRRTDWHWEFATDPTLLMRFSAATANTHRIHYDWPYATRVEGYPDLVVHGPLITLALAEIPRLLRWSGRSGRPIRLSHRNLAPLFCGQTAQMCAHLKPHRFSIELFGPDRATTEPNARLELEIA